MKIITQKMRKEIPAYGTFRHTPTKDIILHTKLFTPWADWTWYIADADFENGICFGMVDGFEREWGDFCLDEILELSGPGGLKVERDRWFTPCKIDELPAFG